MAEMIFIAGGCWGRKTEKESPIVGLRSCSIITVAHAGPPRRCLAAGRGPALCTDVSLQPHCTMNELFSTCLFLLFPPLLLSLLSFLHISFRGLNNKECFCWPKWDFHFPCQHFHWSYHKDKLINMIKHTHTHTICWVSMIMGTF